MALDLKKTEIALYESKIDIDSLADGTVELLKVECRRLQRELGELSSISSNLIGETILELLEKHREATNNVNENLKYTKFSPDEQAELQYSLTARGDLKADMVKVCENFVAINLPALKWLMETIKEEIIQTQSDVSVFSKEGEENSEKGLLELEMHLLQRKLEELHKIQSYWQDLETAKSRADKCQWDTSSAIVNTSGTNSEVNTSSLNASSLNASSLNASSNSVGVDASLHTLVKLEVSTDAVFEENIDEQLEMVERQQHILSNHRKAELTKEKLVDRLVRKKDKKLNQIRLAKQAEFALKKAALERHKTQAEEDLVLKRQQIKEVEALVQATRARKQQAEVEIQSLRLSINVAKNTKPGNSLSLSGMDAYDTQLAQEAMAVANSLGQGDEETEGMRRFEARKQQEWDLVARLYEAAAEEVKVGAEEKCRYDKIQRQIDIEEERFYWSARQHLVAELQKEIAEFRAWEKSLKWKERERLLHVIVDDETKRTEQEEAAQKFREEEQARYDEEKTRLEEWKEIQYTLRAGCSMFRLKNRGFRSCNKVHVYLDFLTKDKKQTYIVRWQSRAKSIDKTFVRLQHNTQLYLDSSHGLFAKKKNPFANIEPDNHAFAFSIHNGPRPRDQLDLVCRNRKDYEMWTNFLQRVLKEGREKQATTDDNHDSDELEQKHGGWDSPDL